MWFNILISLFFILLIAMIAYDVYLDHRGVRVFEIGGKYISIPTNNKTLEEGLGNEIESLCNVRLPFGVTHNQLIIILDLIKEHANK